MKFLDMNGVLTFLPSSIIAIPIAQALFLSSLRTQLSQLLPALDSAVVIAAGASNLDVLAQGSSTVLESLQKAYSASLKGPYILALSATCAAVAVAPLMEWRNIKKEAKRRELLTEPTTSSPSPAGTNEKLTEKALGQDASRQF